MVPYNSPIFTAPQGDMSRFVVDMPHEVPRVAFDPEHSFLSLPGILPPATSSLQWTTAGYPADASTPTPSPHSRAQEQPLFHGAASYDGATDALIGPPIVSSPLVGEHHEHGAWGVGSAQQPMGVGQRPWNGTPGYDYVRAAGGSGVIPTANAPGGDASVFGITTGSSVTPTGSSVGNQQFIGAHNEHGATGVGSAQQHIGVGQRPWNGTRGYDNVRAAGGSGVIPTAKAPGGDASVFRVSASSSVAPPGSSVVNQHFVGAHNEHGATGVGSAQQHIAVGQRPWNDTPGVGQRNVLAAGAFPQHSNTSTIAAAATR
ncbi:uncharacterized protein LOC119731258 [Patiria miniata]|uniref:Uncharacterized protein n=1 Tax=Patiria miniata TaxID=46514 RepID=A0A914AA45_PATMI|nr:uncharacterized protein LOC119731258 [Patiria miniata]